MGVWSHVIIEGFCTFSWASQKKWEGIEYRKGPGRRKKFVTENEHYVPRTERPKWCRKINRTRIPMFECLCDKNEKRCPFFGMVEAEEADARVMNRALNKYYKEMEKKEE